MSCGAVNIECVVNAIAQSPRKSTCRLAQQVNITHTSVHRILKNDLKLYPYKVQLVHQLLLADRVHRAMFSEWFVNKRREENDFVQHLITSDEDIGKMFILPATFTGSPRHMHEYAQDAMAYVRNYGRPHLFITFTCMA
jgi:hypothetical protein